jgi:hypothetical protein
MGIEQVGDTDIVFEIIDADHGLIGKTATGLAHEGPRVATDVNDRVAFNALQNLDLAVR